MDSINVKNFRTLNFVNSVEDFSLCYGKNFLNKLILRQIILITLINT